MTTQPGALGRRVPADDEHIRKYALRAAMQPPPPAATVERTLPLAPFRRQYDQGQEGACVGYGSTWTESIRYGRAGNHPRFDPEWLYRQAQLADDWPETPPEDGTSVRAAFDVLRAVGHRLVRYGKEGAPDLKWAVKENRWATTVDEVRASIAAGEPVTLGVNWYTAFDSPQQEKPHGDWWIAKDGELGTIRGGHCICCYGASDRRQAVKLVNSWGAGWPLVYLPYTVLARLLNEDGEAAVITA